MSKPYTKVRRTWLAYLALGAIPALWCNSAMGQESGLLYGVKAMRGHILVRELELGSSADVLERGRLPQPDSRRVMSVFQTADRGVGLVNTAAGGDADYRSEIRMIGTPSHVMDASTQPVAGIAASAAVSSLIVLGSGSSLAFVGRRAGTPPFALVTLRAGHAQVTVLNMALSQRARYDRLTQCPDGTIYALAINPERDERLVRIDLERHTVDSIAKLQSYGAPRSMLHDLACGPSGALYALADVDGSGINVLLKVDMASGNMTTLRKFDVDRMVFVH